MKNKLDKGQPVGCEFGEEPYGGVAVAEPGGGVGAAEAEAETSRPSSKTFLKKDMIKK